MQTREKTYLPGLRKIITYYKVKDAILCSVVPAIGRRIEKDSAILLGNRPLVVGTNVRVPIKNLYRKPHQLGADRLVNAYAARILYGAPLIALDFGTAITFDVVSGRGEYLGGLILPGLGVSLEALSRSTAVLPNVRLKHPREFIGRDTESCILSGIINGFSALTDELVGNIKAKLKKDAFVVATGGDAKFMSGYCKSFKKIDNELTLKGLNLIFLANKK